MNTVKQEIKDTLTRKDEDMLKTILENLNECPRETLLWVLQEEFKLSPGTLTTLIAKGADINARDDQGKTVLMLALEANYTSCAELIIYNGANIHTSDNSGKTTLDHITDLSPSSQELYFLLILLGENDEGHNYLSLLLQKTFASEEQIRQAYLKIDHLKHLSRLSLKYRAREFLFKYSTGRGQDYRLFVQKLLQTGHLPPGLKSFLIFKDDIAFMMDAVLCFEGLPLYIKDTSISSDFHEDLDKYGTIGGLCALTNLNGTSQKEIFSLTADHNMMQHGLHHTAYVTCSEVDYLQERVLTIGSQVPYRIPLRFDKDEDLENDTESEDDEDEDEDEEPTYDIACILAENETVKSQFISCSLCCSRPPNKELIGSTVIKLGSGPNATKGRLLALNGTAELKVEDRTVFVTNMAVICSIDDNDPDVEFTSRGDGGTIVCIEDTFARNDNMGRLHSPDCFMIIAGLPKENIYNKWGRCVSLAFSLYDALKALEHQVNEGDDDNLPERQFILSCCGFALQ